MKVYEYHHPNDSNYANCVVLSREGDIVWLLAEAGSERAYLELTDDLMVGLRDALSVLLEGTVTAA